MFEFTFSVTKAIKPNCVHLFTLILHIKLSATVFLAISVLIMNVWRFCACVTLFVSGDDVLHLVTRSGGEYLHQHLLVCSCPLQVKPGNVTLYVCDYTSR